MAHPDFPITNDWFLFPNADIVRINSTGEDFVEIQFSDGSCEMIDNTIWLKLGAERLDRSEGWLKDDDENLQDSDFISLGVAPGTEGVDFAELYPEHE